MYVTDMYYLNLGILLIAIFVVTECHPDPVPGYNNEEPIYYGTFPDGFLWGTATAAYQVSYDFLIKTRRNPRFARVCS